MRYLLNRLAIVALVFIAIALSGRSQSNGDRLRAIQATGVILVGGIPEPGELNPRDEMQIGAEMELVRKFAQSLGVQVQWQYFDDAATLNRALREGRLDVATGLRIAVPSLSTQLRDPKIAFGPIYEHSPLVVAYKRGQAKPRRLQDLRAGEWLAPSDLPSTLRGSARPQSGMLDSHSALARLSNAQVQASVTTANQLRAMRVLFPRLGQAFPAGITVGSVWGVPRAHSQSLRHRILLFFRAISKDGSLAQIRHANRAHLQSLDGAALQILQRHQRERLPSLRDAFVAYASAPNITPSLLAAAAYQESVWDPHAVSPTGVRGVMMLTRETAVEMGVSDRRDATQSIQGGAEYLRQLHARFVTEVKPEDAIWFALAAYNLGRRHVLNAMSSTRGRANTQHRWLDVAATLAATPTAAPAQPLVLDPIAPRRKETALYVRKVRRFHDALAFTNRRLALQAK